MVSPAAIVSMVPSRSLASSPSPTVTFTFTSVSVLSPWLATWTSKARSPETGTVALSPGTSATPPRDTPTRPLPWRPPVVSSSPDAAGAHLADRVGHALGLEPLDVGDEGAGRDGDPADVLVLEHLGQAGPEAARVDHVAGQEHLHLARHALGALTPRLVAEGVGQVLGDPRQAVAPELERLEQVAVGVGDLVRHVEVAGAVHDRRGLDPEAVHLVLGVHRLVGAAGALEQREQLLALAVRLAHEHRGVVGVVLDGALLARVEAAAHAEHEQDQHEQPRARSYRPADHHGLPIGRATGRPAAGTPYGLVRFVEEGHGEPMRIPGEGFPPMPPEYDRAAGRAGRGPNTHPR